MQIYMEIFFTKCGIDFAKLCLVNYDRYSIKPYATCW